MRRSSRRAALPAALAAALYAGNALALPTPDTLIGLAQLGPVAYAALTGFLSALGLGAARKASKRWHSGRGLLAMSIGLAVALVALAVTAAAWIGQRKDEAHARDVASYLRCDDAFHNFVAESRIRAHLRAHGTPIPFTEIAARVAADTDDGTVLVTIGGPTAPRLSYDAGFFAAGREGRLRRFSFAYAGELKGFLAAQGDAGERGRRALILDCSAACLLLPEPSQDPELWALVKSFRSFNWILVNDPSGAADPARVRPRLLAEHGYVAAADGSLLRSVETPPKESAWPVRDESLYFRDEAHVRFPNWTRLLSAEELPALMAEPGTYIVAPYYGRLRHPTWQRELLMEHLRERIGPQAADHAHGIRLQRAAYTAAATSALTRAHVLMVDLSSATASKDIQNVVEQLRGKPFFIVSMTSLDWVHGGLDVASAVHKDSARSGAPFGYLGATLQLADHAARASLAAAPPASTKPVRWLRSMAADVVERAKATPAGVAGAVVLLAAAAWLLTLPFTLPGSIHAARRIFARERQPGFIPRGRPWARRWMERVLRYSPGWDLAGGAVLLLLLLAGFELLSHAGGPFDPSRGRSQLPSPHSQALLALLVALRMAVDIGLSARRPLTARRAGLMTLVWVVFAFLIVRYVPPAIAVFASTLLVLRTLVDIGVRRREGFRLQRLVMPLALADASLLPSGAAWALLDDADDDGMGAKARMLARLRRARPGFFSVPPGAVVRPGIFLPLAQAEQRRQLGAMVNALARRGLAPGARFAVRSSAADEDGARLSMAGRYKSVLDVDIDGLPEAIREVHASYGAGRADAVLVQEMARADFSGVLFTRAPENAAVARIEFVAGLAEDLVAGKVAPLEVLIGRASGHIASHDERHGDMLRDISAAGLAMEAAAGTPLDVEFAYDSNLRKLAILQARPITMFVHDADIAAEQLRLLAMAPGELPPDLHRSSVAEVAEAANPFTASLLLRLYAPEGALGIAARRLEVAAPRGLVLAFGRLYAPAADRWTQVREALRSGWTRMKLRRLGRRRAEALIRECRAALTAGREGFADPAVSGLDARFQAQKVAATLALFVREVYPGAFAATLLAGALNEHGEGEALRTTTSELAHDLARLARDGDVESFLGRWGHRSAADYDLGVKSFAEDPAAAREYAEGFAGLDERPQGTRPATGAAQRFIALREEMKDGCLRALRGIRPEILSLGAALGFETREDVFFLTLEDIEAIAAARIDLPSARARAHDRRRAWAAYSRIELPDSVTPRDIEFLEAPEPAGAGLGDRRRGRMLSVRQGFRGRVVTDPKHVPASGEPVVLLTRFLRPEIVGAFPRVTGVVTAVGSYLSHATIVAREHGVPVLLLPDARAWISDGDAIEVSLSGEVERLSRQASVPRQSAA